MSATDGKVVLELDLLRELECGIGQVALHLGRAIVAESARRGRMLLALTHRSCRKLLPENAHLLPLTKWYKEKYVKYWRRVPKFPCERNALWHVIHQNSRYWPAHQCTPVLLTIQDIDFIRLTPPETWPRQLRNIQDQIDRARGIAVTSKAVENDLHAYLRLEGKPLRVIPLGVQPRGVVQPEPIPELVGKQFLFSIGVFVEKKNFQALAAMMEHLPEYQLVLAGNDTTEFAGVLREQIRRSPWRDRVRILGRVSDGARQWLYEHCTAFLFPAYAEGFGLPALEAINGGRPTILAHRTSLPEIGGPEGFYWHDFAAESMAKVVRESLAAAAADPDRLVRIQSRASRFSWTEAARQYVDWYDEILSAELSARHASRGRRAA